MYILFIHRGGSNDGSVCVGTMLPQNLTKTSNVVLFNTSTKGLFPTIVCFRRYNSIHIGPFQ